MKFTLKALAPFWVSDLISESVEPIISQLMK